MKLINKVFCKHDWELIGDEYVIFQRVCTKCKKRENVGLFRDTVDIPTSVVKESVEKYIDLVK